MTVALALMSPAAAWVSTQRPVPFLRWLAGGLAVVVTARLGWDPRVAGTDLGTTPIFNWLLWGYGVPAASFCTRRSHHAAPGRRCADPHGGSGRDPVLDAAGVPGDSPLHDRRRHLSKLQPPRRNGRAGLRFPGDGAGHGTHHSAHRQHRPQYRRCRPHGAGRHRRVSQHRLRLVDDHPAVRQRCHRRYVLQRAVAGLRHACGAGDHPVTLCRRTSSCRLREHDRRQPHWCWR